MTLLGKEPGIPLATKRGSRIANNGPAAELPPDRMREAERLWKREISGIKIRSHSSSYNCVGLPFASRRAVIDNTLILWILEEDGYRQIHENNVQPGDLVVYYGPLEPTPSHIGVVIRLKRLDVAGRAAGKPRIVVLSQWGFDGEYEHGLGDVPTLYGDRWEFWTDRIAL